MTPYWTNPGADARVRILNSGIDLAWKEGLEKVSFRSLARAELISKSGVFEHFGSKLKLQEQIVERAAERFEMEVIDPIRLVPAGVGPFWEIIDRWLAHIAGRTYSPGLLAVVMDACRGKTRGMAAECVDRWLGVLEFELIGYQTCSLLRPESDPAQLTFEIYSILDGAYWCRTLGREDACDRARVALRSRLEGALTERGLCQLAEGEAAVAAKAARRAATGSSFDAPECVQGPPDLRWLPGPGLRQADPVDVNEEGI